MKRPFHEDPPLLSELAFLLSEHDLAMMAYPTTKVQGDTEELWWVVWLYPPDEPEAVSIGQGQTLVVAIEAAWSELNG